MSASAGRLEEVWQRAGSSGRLEEVWQGE
jgi:hypothetical protein